MRVVVTGVAGSVGSRVAASLVALPDVDVVGIDRVRRNVEGLTSYHVGDLRNLDLEPLLAEADAVVHLASAYGSDEFVDASVHDTRATRVVLDAAALADVSQFVLLSSAMVYGARDENPIPLTELAPIAPNPLAFAENKATLERLALEWEAETGAALTILRPTTAVASQGSSWVARTLQLAAGLGSDSNPHMQFLHLDDLAEAVVAVVHASAPGVFNVAPDGWVRADEVRQLSGRTPRLPIPKSVADQIVRLSWEAGVVATPPGIMNYATFSWVVSNDAIRALGWSPQHSNVEAYVEGYDARPWAMLNAKRRQQIALSGTAAATAAIGLIARSLTRRFRS